MNPLSFIPAGWLIWVRIAAMVLLVALGFGVAWTIDNWRLGTDLQALKAEHNQTVADAAKASLVAQQKADTDHAKLTGDLAASSAAHHEDLTRSEHANDLLRADLASGARVLRIAATCPASPGNVPETASGGRLDTGAGAVLTAAAGSAYLTLRSRITLTEHQLAACQDAAVKLTGQARPAP